MGCIWVTLKTGLGASVLQWGWGTCTLHKWSGVEDGIYSNSELLHLLQTDESFNKQLRNIKSSQTLTKDEMSMLRGKLFAQVKYVCRHLRANCISKYLGGIHVFYTRIFSITSYEK